MSADIEFPRHVPPEALAVKRHVACPPEFFKLEVHSTSFLRKQCRVSRGRATNAVPVHHLNVVVGSNVRRLRTQAAYSREELASRAQVDWTYLGAIERGQRNPSVAILARLAAALDVKPSDFFVSDPSLEFRIG